MQWKQVKWEVSTSEYCFVDVDSIPRKGVGRLTIALPPAPPNSYNCTVDYLSVDGIVINLSLIKDEAGYVTFHDYMMTIIKKVDVRATFRM